MLMVRCAVHKFSTEHGEICMCTDNLNTAKFESSLFGSSSYMLAKLSKIIDCLCFLISFLSIFFRYGSGTVGFFRRKILKIVVYANF